MNADIAGALQSLNTNYKAFEHNGRRMTKDQVRKVLKYGIKKGYTSTGEFTDKEVDKILNETT